MKRIKRREFEQMVDDEFGGGERESASRVAQWVEALGVEWDPEEPELPKEVRLSWRCGEAFDKPSRPYLTTPEGRSLSLREAAAVVDTYSMLQSGELVDRVATASMDQIAAHSLAARIKEAMEYLDPKDTVYRILNGEEP